MNLPPGTKRRTRPGSPRPAPAAAPPPAAPPPAYFTLHPERPPSSSASQDQAEKLLHVSSWILNKNTAAAAGAGAAPPPPPAPAEPAPRDRRLPGDCGGEPLLAAAAPGTRRPSSSKQQSQKEEVLRSRRAPRSAAISCPRAAAAAPRSPRLLPSRAPQPVLRCRLGSGGRRRCSSPARPGPHGPSRGRGDSGAPPSCRGAEEEGRAGGRSVHSGRGEAVGVQVPGAATRRRLRLHTPARGGRRRRGWGAGTWGADPRARARAPPSPAHPRLRARPPSAPIPAAAWLAAAAGPLPSHFSLEPRTGAGRAPGAAAGVRETPEKRILLLPASARLVQPLGSGEKLPSLTSPMPPVAET